jgi:tRNA dimethylallyltransferase
MKNPIIILTGPTASGKTAMSLKLADEFNGEIIAADSMTVYRGMDIGTDKPGLNQNSKIKSQNDNVKNINGVQHYLIDILNPDEPFNAAIFKEKATEAVVEIQKRGKIPFLVGGSTMFIDAFAYDYTMPEVEPDDLLRKELEQKSNDELFQQLVELDPDAEWTVDRNNKRRLVRALEVTLKTGIPFTAQKSKKDLAENILYLAIEVEREELYQKINNRVDQMMGEGFLNEVKILKENYDHNTAMQAAGYKQLTQYLDGEIRLEEAVEKTKQAHRNYAKRQLTWLKANPDVVWIKNLSEAEQNITEFLKRRTK